MPRASRYGLRNLDERPSSVAEFFAKSPRGHERDGSFGRAGFRKRIKRTTVPRRTASDAMIRYLRGQEVAL